MDGKTDKQTNIRTEKKHDDCRDFKLLLNRLNSPHILVCLYDKTNQTVTNDVRNDE